MRTFVPALVLTLLTSAHSAGQALQQVGSIAVTGGFGLRSPIMTDFDANGIIDFVHQDAGTNTVQIVRDVGLTMPNAATSTLVLDLVPFATGFLNELLAVEDIDGDGNQDLLFSVWGFFPNDLTVYLARGTGGGAVAAPVAIIGRTATYSGASAAELADFDGDGDTDIAFSMQAPPGTLGSAVEIWLQDPSSSTGFVVGPSVPVANGTAAQIASGDVNGDGAPDVIFADPRNLVTLFGESATTTFGTTRSIPISVSSAGFLRAVGDLNGDGIDDVVLRIATLRVEVLFGGPNGFVAGPTLALSTSRAFEIGRGTDLDKDGNVDLMFFANGSVPQILILRGDGTGAFSPNPVTMPVPEFGFALADLDKDDDIDLMITDRAATIFRYENRALYGGACAGVGNFVPRLEIGAGIPGNAGFAVDLRGTPPGSNYEILMAFGTAPTATSGCGLHVDLTTVLLPQVTMPFMGTTNAHGAATLSIPLPVTVPVAPLFFQGLVLDPSGALSLGPLQLAGTRGRAIELF